MNQFFKQLSQKAEELNFSGVISIFQHSTAIFDKAFGFRDIANNLPNETNTKFGIASGTKLFTALGIGKLIEQQKIQLDTTIKDINTTYTFIDPKATILQLLSHSSGIYDFFDEELFPDSDEFFVDIPWYQLETPSDYLPLFLDQRPKFQAGERFSYSNGGFVFLAMLIEELTGMSYRTYLKEHVLGPANMTQSGFFALNALPPNTATGYLGNRTTSNIYNLPIRGGGDGGMFTTSYDLLSFWHRLFSFEILAKDLTEDFLTTHWTFDHKSGYGLGLYKELDHSMYSIVGGDAGVGFDSRFFPDKDLVINILSNITDGEEDMRAYILTHVDKLGG